MKWKATRDEAANETGEEETISTTQTDFLAFSSLLLGYFETYPSKHSCIHSYFIPPPSPSALTLFFDQRRGVGSQQEGSLPAKKEKEGQRAAAVLYTLPYIHCCTSSFSQVEKRRGEEIEKRWNKIYEWYANDRLKNTCEAHNFPQTTRLLNEISTQFRELGFRPCKARQHNHTKRVSFYFFPKRTEKLTFPFFFFFTQT